MFNKFTNFYFPEIPTGAGAGTGNSAPAGAGRTLSQIEDFLKDDTEAEVIPLDDKKDKDKKVKADKEEIRDEPVDDEEDDEDEEEDDEEEPDELEEIEDELEESDDEKLELSTPPKRRDILKKYPTLFKEFPELEKSYYRERAFTELLPTIDDAKEAVAKSKTLDNFENDLMDGNLEPILKSVKSSDEGAFHKLADNLLTALSNTDKDVYTHICGNIGKHIIAAMYQMGNDQGNDALKNAAAVLNQFLFNKTHYEPPQKLYKEEKKDDKEDKINEREKNYRRQRLEESVDDLNTKVNNAFKNTIIQNIDKKGSMTEYVKSAAVRDASEELERVMSSDKRFQVIVDKLWDKAIKEDFSKESIDTIKRAYSSKARTVLPALIEQARIKALKGMGKRVKEAVEDEDTDNDESNNAAKQTVRRTHSSNSNRNEPPRSNRSGRRPGESTADFLMRD